MLLDADPDDRRDFADAGVTSASSPLTLRAVSIDDDVYGAADPVPTELPELAGFRDDTRAGERGVAVN